MATVRPAGHPEAFPWLPVDWQAEAICAELPEAEADALFFPERGRSSKAAKALCAQCPVRVECLDYALEGGDRFGIWGGTSELDRRKLRRNRVSTAA